MDAMAIDVKQKGVLEPSIYLDGKSSKQKTGSNLKCSHTGGSKNGVIVDRVYAGKVLASIPDGKIFDMVAWFVYGPSINVGNFEEVLEYVFDEFRKTKLGQKNSLLKYRNSKRINELVVFVVLNYRYSRLKDGAHKNRYSKSEICTGAKILMANWARDWAPVYDAMENVLEKIDRKTLSSVRAMIEEEKRKGAA